MKILSYRYLPLNMFLAYSLFVISGLFLAPIKYQGLNYWILCSYLALLIVLFTYGYVKGSRGPIYRVVDSPSSVAWIRDRSYRSAKFLISMLLGMGAFIVVFKFYQIVSADEGLSIYTIGEKRLQQYEGYERGQANVDLNYILRILGLAISTLTVLFGIYYYKCMGVVARSLVFLIIFAYVVIYVLGEGRLKYLGDIVIFLTFCWFVNSAVVGRRFRVRTVSLAVASVCLVGLSFLEVLRQRYLAIGIDLSNIAEKAHPLMSYDETSIIYSVFGPEYGFALGVLLFYFTNGLYGLYLSLTLPFEWTYFVGNSYSLGRIAEIVAGNNGAVLEHTYPYRVGEEYGWDLSKWHSLFSWLASDITFTGVLILTPFFSFFYARVWIASVNASNVFAGPLFLYLSLGVIFSYANNQLVHTLQGFIVLVVLVSGLFLHHMWRRR